MIKKLLEAIERKYGCTDLPLTEESLDVLSKVLERCIVGVCLESDLDDKL